jgi:hypothetical protein
VSIEFLHKALETDLGIVVQTSDPEALRTRLYQIRAKAKNPAFECLVFKPSVTNPTSELWIIKNPPKETTP